MAYAPMRCDNFGVREVGRTPFVLASTHPDGFLLQKKVRETIDFS
jgi:hypothetical protein